MNSDTIEKFKNHWAKFDPEGTGFIRIYELPKLLFSLGDPLGFSPDYYNDKEKQE